MKRFEGNKSYPMASWAAEQMKFLRAKIIGSGIDLKMPVGHKLISLNKRKALDEDSRKLFSSVFVLSDICATPTLPTTSASISSDLSSQQNQKQQPIQSLTPFNKSEVNSMDSHEMRTSTSSDENSKPKRVCMYALNVNAKEHVSQTYSTGYRTLVDGLVTKSYTLELDEIIDVCGEWKESLQHMEFDACNVEDYDLAETIHTHQIYVLTRMIRDLLKQHIESISALEKSADEQLRHFNVLAAREIVLKLQGVRESVNEMFKKWITDLFNNEKCTLISDKDKIQASKALRFGLRSVAKHKKNWVGSKVMFKRLSALTTAMNHLMEAKKDNLSSTHSRSGNPGDGPYSTVTRDTIDDINKQGIFLKESMMRRTRDDMFNTTRTNTSTRSIHDTNETSDSFQWDQLDNICSDMISKYASDIDKNGDLVRQRLHDLTIEVDKEKAKRRRRVKKFLKYVGMIGVLLIMMIYLIIIIMNDDSQDIVIPPIANTGQCTSNSQLPKVCLDLRQNSSDSHQIRHNTSFSGYHYSTIDMDKSFYDRVMNFNIDTFAKFLPSIYAHGGGEPAVCQSLYTRYVCDYYWPPCAEDGCTPLPQCTALCQDLYLECLPNPGPDITHFQKFLPDGESYGFISMGLSDEERYILEFPVFTFINECSPLKDMDNSMAHINLDSNCFADEIKDYTKACATFKYGGSSNIGSVCYPKDECPDCYCPT
eukprot:TRINITY_DN308968_c0_g1_i2.p1 TRINITY_DN308968_c0_g1~~TRINITY_DN308968_c0_g1_i2.p1  ORF type:complete len:708 (+),score=107.05 TRINITY_DN308968_c0_g1_i2:385-2508(+)